MRDSGHRGRKSQGFTLLEALIVVVILVILLMMGVPTFRDFAASRAVSAHVSDLSGALRLARTEAIKRGVPVTLCRSDDPIASSPACAAGTDWSTGWILFVDRGTAGTIDTGDFIIRIQESYANSGGITRTGGGALMTFQPTGIAPAAQSNFLFRPRVPSDSDSYAPLSRRMCMTNTGATRVLEGETTCS